MEKVNELQRQMPVKKQRQTVSKADRDAFIESFCDIESMDKGNRKRSSKEPWIRSWISLMR